MLTLEQKAELLGDGAVILRCPDYADALIGVDVESGRAVYDVDVMIDAMMKDDGMSLEDAREWLEYNVISPCAKNWPIFIRTFE